MGARSRTAVSSVSAETARGCASTSSRGSRLYSRGGVYWSARTPMLAAARAAWTNGGHGHSVLHQLHLLWSLSGRCLVDISTDAQARPSGLSAATTTALKMTVTTS